MFVVLTFHGGIESENECVVATGGWEGRKGGTTYGCRVYLGDDENVLEVDQGDVAQPCEY